MVGQARRRRQLHAGGRLFYDEDPEAFLTQFPGHMLEPLAGGGMGDIDIQHCLDEGDDPPLDDPLLQEKTCLRVTSESPGDPDVMENFSLSLSLQHQPHVLDEITPAAVIGNNTDLEFLGKPLESRIAGKVPLEPAGQ